MKVWQITTPRLAGNITSDPQVNLKPEDRVVRWQFKDEQAAKLFLEGIRLEEREEG